MENNPYKFEHILFKNSDIEIQIYELENVVQTSNLYSFLNNLQVIKRYIPTHYYEIESNTIVLNSLLSLEQAKFYLKVAVAVWLYENWNLKELCEPLYLKDRYELRYEKQFKYQLKESDFKSAKTLFIAGFISDSFPKYSYKKSNYEFDNTNFLRFISSIKNEVFYQGKKHKAFMILIEHENDNFRSKKGIAQILLDEKMFSEREYQNETDCIRYIEYLMQNNYITKERNCYKLTDKFKNEIKPTFDEK